MSTVAKILTAEQHAELNEAVRHATAFPCWKAMREAMVGGYVPTLRDDYGDRQHKTAVRVIRCHLLARGWKFFDGRKLIG